MMLPDARWCRLSCAIFAFLAAGGSRSGLLTAAGDHDAAAGGGASGDAGVSSGGSATGGAGGTGGALPSSPCAHDVMPVVLANLSSPYGIALDAKDVFVSLEARCSSSIAASNSSGYSATVEMRWR
jgi:hypothetical protein